MENLADKVRDIMIEKLSINKGSHDFDHTERVHNLAVHLAKAEGADLEIIELAAWLHDIARKEEDDSNGAINHALKGAEIAREVLLDLEVSEDKINRVCECIARHRFRDNNTPETLEEKIIFDADKLDSIGAVGLGRAYLFAGEVGARMHDPNVDIEKTAEYTKEDTAYREFLVKLSKIKDKIQTDEGKRLAEHRHKFMAEFFEEMNAEVAGER
ncbi:MAG: HD domain-containing protein [Patescibacteria group bacterium]